MSFKLLTICIASRAHYYISMDIQLTETKIERIINTIG